ncbi:MAG: OB-fold domain-containing protein [Acidobacteria bacterium]|nr:OB-fold domain-containing protein [Acidobacteriota bacterium]
MTLFHCSACGKAYVARPVYCRCGSQEFRAGEASGKGCVYSCTTLYAAAEKFEKDLPFQIAIIELDDGPRLTARISGRPVEIGDAVTHLHEQEGVHFFQAA